MDHQKGVAGKSMSRILSFLPRATSSVTFQNPPIYVSEKAHKSHLGIGFSGPLGPLNSSETHRKIKNDVVYEPTSPRVSCMGQVKCKHYRKLTGVDTVIPNKPSNRFSRSSTSCNVARMCKTEEDVQEKGKKKLGFRSLFHGGAGGGRRKSDATDAVLKLNTATELTSSIPKGPCLGTIKRFSSGRETFMNFDWTTQVAPAPAPAELDRRNCFTDGERDGGDGVEVEVVMPSSVPVMVRNGGVGDGFVRVGGVNVEARKEICLWKRRTMAQPKPLQLHGGN